MKIHICISGARFFRHGKRKKSARQQTGALKVIDAYVFVVMLCQAAFLLSFLDSQWFTQTAQEASPMMFSVVRPMSNRRSMP